MHVGLDERDQVRPSLAHDEMVDIEQLGDTSKRRVAVRIRRVCPVAEVNSICRCPGYNLPMGVFTEHCCFASAIEGRGGGIRGDGSSPNQLSQQGLV
jgi:hypothetical protein